MKIVIASLLVYSCLGSFFATSGGSEIQAFITGLEKGLQKGGADACTEQIDALNADGQKVLADLKSLVEGHTSYAKELVADVDAIVKGIPAFNTKCQIGDLAKQLLELLNPKTGYDLMTKRIAANKGIIDASTVVIVGCYGAPHDCNWEDLGDAWGTIIRVVTQWGI